MSKHDRAAARAAAEYRDKFERSERTYKESSRKDRGRDQERPHKSRRHRSPSYDSASDSDDSFDTVYSREPSPRRPSRRHTTAASHSDPEDRGYRGRDKERRRRDSYSDYSPSPERTRRGVVDDLLAAVGIIQNKQKDRGHSTRDGRSRDDDERKKNVAQALQAALTAAAMEAFRTRKEGKFTPQRIMQIAGAAIAAGGMDALIDNRSGGNGNSMKHLIESIVAGLATSKTMGKTIKQKREGSVDNKMKTGMVGMAARQLLARSLSKGAGTAPRRRRTDRY